MIHSNLETQVSIFLWLKQNALERARADTNVMKEDSVSEKDRLKAKKEKQQKEDYEDEDDKVREWLFAE